MPKMTRIVAPALIAAMGLSVAIPAQARDYSREQSRDYRQDVNEGNRYHNTRRTPVRTADIRSDLIELRRDIDRAAARRAISRREAAGLRQDLRELQRIFARSARNGLTIREHRMLENRVARLRVDLRSERRDNDRRRG